MDSNNKSGIIKRAFDKDKSAIAHLISFFENQSLSYNQEKNKLFYKLKEISGIRKKKFAYIIGISGQPGAGKSTLINQIVKKILQKDNNISIAVIAIDPTSPNSRGAILGDRTRMHFSTNKDRVFFRSQANKLEYGGLSPITFEAMRILGFFYDIIIIETVGVGQNELDITYISDLTSLLVSIQHGDQIQFIKSGIMEVPDCFIINKADDMKNARKTYYNIQSALEFLNYFDKAKLTKNKKKYETPIFLTSATNNIGLDSLSDYFYQSFNEFTFHWNSFFEKQKFFFIKNFEKKYGEYGLKILEQKLFSKKNHDSIEELKEKSHNIMKQYIKEIV